MKHKDYKIMNKSQYRQWAKELRVSLGNEGLLRKSTAVVSKIKKLDVYKNATTVMSYLAKDIEINLQELFNDNSKKWFLPVVEMLHATSLLVVPYQPGETKLVKNKFDILEPELSENEIKKAKLQNLAFDIIFVPGLCFDQSGNRIGFGKGFYDSFLSLNKKSFKIGCCPKECFINESIPTGKWDIAVDLVITD